MIHRRWCPAFILHSSVHRLPHLQITRRFTPLKHNSCTTYFTPLSDTDTINSRCRSVCLVSSLYSSSPLTSVPLSLRGWRQEAPTLSALTKGYKHPPHPLSSRRRKALAFRPRWAALAALTRPQPAVAFIRVGHNTDSHWVFPGRPRGDVKQGSHNPLPPSPPTSVPHLCAKRKKGINPFTTKFIVLSMPSLVRLALLRDPGHLSGINHWFLFV